MGEMYNTIYGENGLFATEKRKKNILSIIFKLIRRLKNNLSSLE